MPINIIRLFTGAASSDNLDASGSGNGMPSCLFAWSPGSISLSDISPNANPGTWEFALSVGQSGTETHSGRLELRAADTNTFITNVATFEGHSNGNITIYDSVGNVVNTGNPAAGNVTHSYCYVCPVLFRVLWLSGCANDGLYNVTVYANGVKSGGCT